MKIVIFNGIGDHQKYEKYWDSTQIGIRSLRALEIHIEENPNEDIEGIILPSAVNNPEFGDILQRIYYHKLLRYQDGIVLVAKHTQFAEKIKEKYGIILQ